MKASATPAIAVISGAEPGVGVSLVEFCTCVSLRKRCRNDGTSRSDGGDARVPRVRLEGKETGTGAGVQHLGAFGHPGGVTQCRNTPRVRSPSTVSRTLDAATCDDWTHDLAFASR